MAEIIPFPFPEHSECELREAIELVEAFAKIKDPTARWGLIQMAKQMGAQPVQLHPTPAGDLQGERAPPEQRRPHSV